MNLQDFVRESLLQVVAGVKEAKEQAEEKGAYINPAGLALKHDRTLSYDPDTNIPTTVFEFDVAVTAGTETEARAGAGLKVAFMEIGGHGKTESQSSSISRIRFSVPVLLPKGKEFKRDHNRFSG